jgi:hypothetical protein
MVLLLLLLLLLLLVVVHVLQQFVEHSRLLELSQLYEYELS